MYTYYFSKFLERKSKRLDKERKHLIEIYDIDKELVDEVIQDLLQTKKIDSSSEYNISEEIDNRPD